MTVTLAATWRPRGELWRFKKLLPQFRQVYEHIVISLPPDVDAALLAALSENPATGKNPPEHAGCLRTVVNPEWSWGRFVALQEALKTSAGHIQYADLDRLLRWVETYPQEWRETVELVKKFDCLIIGRTDAAYDTHPRAMLRTEAISNGLVSHLLGMPVDVSAGSKGFSRRAVAFLLANTSPGHPFGTDAEWPLLLKRAGFAVDYVMVDGLDWESADRYKERAADAYSQHEAARDYDIDPSHWAYRVEVAYEIVQSALQAVERELKL